MSPSYDPKLCNCIAGDGRCLNGFCENQNALSQAMSDNPLAIERRKSLVHVPPAMGDMLRTIVTDLTTIATDMNIRGEMDKADHDTLLDDSNALKNMAALLDVIAEQNGGRPLRVERRVE